MLKFIKKILLVGLVIGLPLVSVVAAPAVSAATKDDVCKGVVAAGGDCNNEAGVNNLIKEAVNIFSYVVGIVAVVMIMVAGFKYITASGDSNSIASAKNTLIYAIIGLVIAISARFITAFVTNRLQ